MNFVLSGTNARIFAKAVHTTAKFGDIYFEPKPDGLSLKSLNSSKSAFITFKFFDNFFSDYEYTHDSRNKSFDGKCKVSIKTFLGIFRNMKQVERCKMSVDVDAEKLIIELNCKLDTRKKYTVSILDIEVLQPGNIGNVENRNKIVGSTKLFSDISNNFQMQEEEITVDAESSQVTVKNYIDGQLVDAKFMRSQLKLKGEEFDIYSIKNESAITFCLREFRALLHFAESVNIDFAMFFEEPGDPVVFKITNLSVFEVTLFMSTLSPDDLSMYEDQPNKTNSRTNPSINDTETEKTIEKSKTPARKELPDTISLDDDEDDPDVTDADLMLVAEKTQTSETNPPNSNAISIPGEIRHQSSNAESFFPQHVNLNMDSDDDVTFVENDIEEDCVPLSPQPPAKKARTLFRRCFEPTFLPSDSNIILALDSDSES